MMGQGGMARRQWMEALRLNPDMPAVVNMLEKTRTPGGRGSPSPRPILSRQSPRPAPALPEAERPPFPEVYYEPAYNPPASSAPAAPASPVPSAPAPQSAPAGLIEEAGSGTEAAPAPAEPPAEPSAPAPAPAAPAKSAPAPAAPVKGPVKPPIPGTPKAKQAEGAKRP